MHVCLPRSDPSVSLRHGHQAPGKQRTGGLPSQKHHVPRQVAAGQLRSGDGGEEWALAFVPVLTLSLL